MNLASVNARGRVTMIQGTETMDQPLAQGGRFRRFGGPGFWIVLVVVVMIAALVLPTIRRWGRSQRSVDRSLLRFSTVTRGDLERQLPVEGRVVAAFHPTLFSPARGLLTVRANPGEMVAAGEILAIVESPELRSRLLQEESALSSLSSELEQRRLTARQSGLESDQKIDLLQVRVEAAERAMGRARHSHEQGLVNDIEYEEAQDELRLSRLELAHARQTAELQRETRNFAIRDSSSRLQRQNLVVEELRRQVEELTLRSPVEALVSAVEARDRDLVEPGQALLSVVDLSAFEIEIEVPESYADEVAPGTPLAIRYGGRELPGEVLRIAPSVQSGLVQGRAAFVGDTPSGLRQNQRVTARLILESHADVLQIERGPFLESGGGHVIYLMEDGLALRRRIECGATSIGAVEIRSGLSEGDEVVISDLDRFREAESVFVRD